MQDCIYESCNKTQWKMFLLKIFILFKYFLKNQKNIPPKQSAKQVVVAHDILFAPKGHLINNKTNG
jgi:hypothetical protein